MNATPDLPPRSVIAVLSLLSYPRVLLNPWLGVFKPLESALLGKLVSICDESTSIALSSQLQLINKVVRVTARTSESNFYRATPWGVDRQRPMYLPDQKEESRIAVITFQAPGSPPREATFRALSGRLFSIEFNADIRRFLSCADPVIVSSSQRSDHVSKPTAGDLLASTRPSPAGGGLTRR
jgi:hypothetical protein